MDLSADVSRSRPSPVNVTLCARAYPPDVAGGGEISTALLARGLAEQGAAVRVLTFTDRPSFTETVDGVRVERLRCPGWYWSMHADRVGSFKKVAWHLEQATRSQPSAVVRNSILRDRPEILHSSTIEDFGPGLWRWASSQGIPTIHTLRSYGLLHRGATLYDAQSDRDIEPDLLSLPKRRLSRSLRGVVGISRYILKRHLDYGFFENAQTTVISNPCDEEVEVVPDRSDERVRLGVLGRISPEKGIEKLIDSLRNLPRGLKWELEIAGTGPVPYVRRVKDLADGLPVTFLGWQKSRDFLRRLDLLVVPSRWQEPFGRIVVEAYSVGIPVICLRRGGLPELVQDGVTGWVLDDWDDLELQAAIIGCRRLSRDAIRFEAQKFSVERLSRQYLDFYQKVLSSDGSGSERNAGRAG